MSDSTAAEIVAKCSPSGACPRRVGAQAESEDAVTELTSRRMAFEEFVKKFWEA